jgi:hypothetical protein
VEDDGESDEDARPRQRPHIESSETEQEEEPSDEDADMNGATSRVDEQLAKKLVRYAIACEYSRTLIKRDGIKERGENARRREREDRNREKKSAVQLTEPDDSSRKAEPFV